MLSDGARIESPLHTVDFLDDLHNILESKFAATTLVECMDSAGISVFKLIRIEFSPYAVSKLSLIELEFRKIIPFKDLTGRHVHFINITF